MRAGSFLTSCFTTISYCLLLISRMVGVVWGFGLEGVWGLGMMLCLVVLLVFGL